jgi:hypothetical protein
MPAHTEPETVPPATRAAALAGGEEPSFGSILHPHPPSHPPGASPPGCFRDLHLDQVVQAALARFGEYDLAPFFLTGPLEPETIAWRHEIFRDLENERLRRALLSFADAMRTLRRQLAAAGKAVYPLEKDRWFLDAAAGFAQAVEQLRHELDTLELAARGWRGFRAHLARYADSAPFRALAAESRELQQALLAIPCRIHLKDGTVTVCPEENDADYPAVIAATFARFRQDAVQDYRVKLHPLPGMNHIDAQIVERVAQLHPEVFARFTGFATRHAGFPPPELVAFDREVQFYLCWLDFLGELRGAGLEFCLPEISATDRTVSGHGAFDLALAAKLVRLNRPVVCNDFAWRPPECIAVVTGPNQGGKTTFARMIGQIHCLAALGLPVPGRRVRLFLCDRIFTHFEREEIDTTLRGKLQDDLVRAKEILEAVTPRSLVVINEIFASTTLEDALWLSRRIMERLIRGQVSAVWVTFIEELSRHDEHTVSYVAGVAPDNPTERTFRIERRPADGFSHALALAAKYGLTQAQLEARFIR